MVEKSFKSRIIHKHDIAENWEKATSFIPLQGEIIVYDIDENYNYERIKIGDGVTNVNDLPFADSAVNEKIDAVGALVGDTSVADQINEALLNNQADWAQNDESAIDYIKNRTHYEEVNTFMNTRTITLDNGGGWMNITEIDADFANALIEKWADAKYEDSIRGVLTPFEGPSNDYWVHLKKDNDNYGAAIVSLRKYDDGTLLIGNDNGSWNSVTISLPQEETVIHHLNPKYIKDMYYETEPVRTEVVPETTVEFNDNFIEEAIDITLIEGTTYFVNWNDMKYECVCYNYEGALVIGNNECWGGSGGNGEPFLVSNYDGLTAINIYESGTYTISISTLETEIHHVPTKYIKDMYYDNGTTITELVPSQTISGFALMNDPMHGVPDPFELLLVKGNTYIVNWDGTEYELKCEYLQGMPAIGNLEFLNDNFDGIPFLVAGNGNFSTILTTSTAESHTISITEIYHDLKQIDIKYLPIMEEAYETVFERNGIVSGSYTTSFNKCIIGMAKVTIDNVSEKVEFVATDGYESWLETDNWFIATYPERIYFEFPDEEEHSVKIEVPKQVVKEEHLPDSVKAIPDWNQNDETAADYIKNRTHYEIPEIWTEVALLDDTWGSRATYKLASTPIEWAENNSYKIRIDNTIYTFEGMERFAGSNATANEDVYYIGADYRPLNTSMGFSEYPFCLLTTDFTNIYAVFEDGTTNHTVEFFESAATIHKLDPKFIPWPDENDALELVAELAEVDPVAAADGSIYTDKNGVIYAL